MLEHAGRADEAIRILGEDIARRRLLSENTLTAYAELPARHGRLDELRELATGQDAHSILPVYASALRDHGQAGEAEAVMREAIAADDWVGYRAWLSSVLLRDSRLDDAIAVIETRPDPWTDPRIVRAGLLSAAGRLADAAAELRDLGTIKAREELFEVLVQQGQAAGAITTHPTAAERRAAKAKTESVPLREDGYSAEPPF